MLSVVVVSYEARDLLAGCLDALARQSADTACEVIVVDNASADGSAAMVAARFPAVRVVSNAVNEGFGRAANRGAALATRDALCFLNSDALVAPGTLARVVAVLRERPDAGAVGPRTVRPDGAHVDSCFRFPTLARPLLNVAAARRLLGAERVTLGYAERPTSGVHRVDWVSGGCLATRRELFLRLGGFDPAYFMYFEDVDLCRRLRAAGFATYYVADAVVVHHTRGSTRGVLTAELFVAEQRSRFRYFDKHHGAGVGALVRLAAVGAAALRTATRPCRRSPAPHDTVAVNLEIVREALRRPRLAVW